LEYMQTQNYSESLLIFQKEAGVQEDASLGALTNILEKKWTSVLRLQKKIIEMESKMEEMTQELQAGSRIPTGQNNVDSEKLFPSKPEKYILKGHRGAINCVAFHPTFTMFASCSDDASIRLWDFESGQFERAMKGHTDQISCVSFDGTGRYLASASWDLTVKIWDLQLFACVKTLYGHEHNVSSVVFSP
jgi:platelet-activating factor acetylhydrolase IB subunit alpha